MNMREWHPEDIKRLRMLLELSQKDFGELLGVTRVYVNYLEKEVKTPSKTLNLLLSYVEKEATENQKTKGDKKHGSGKGRKGTSKRDL